MRVDLKDGSWAELRERPSVAQVNHVRRAYLRINEDNGAGADVALALIQGYVSAWSVKGPDGDIPLERAEDAPDEIVQAFALEAATLFRKKPDPKGSIVRSGSSPPAPES